MQNVFTETRLEDVDLSKTQPCIWNDEIQAISELRKQLQQYTMTLFDCNHLAHVIVLWQMQKFTCFCTVFALLYFEFEGNIQVQAPGGLYFERRFKGGFLRYEFGGLIFGGAYFRNFTALRMSLHSLEVPYTSRISYRVLNLVFSTGRGGGGGDAYFKGALIPK